MCATEKEREGQQEEGRAVYHVTEKGREGQQEKGRAVYHVCDRERKGGAAGEREGSVSCV